MWGHDDIEPSQELLGGWTVVAVSPVRVRLAGVNGLQFELDRDGFWGQFGKLLDTYAVPHP